MKTVRPIPIADHLWETLERMAEEMGADREGLVNQALHVFARLNGYLVPGAVGQARPPEAPPRPPPERLAVAEQVLEAAARLERDLPRAPAPGAATIAAPAGLVLERDDGGAEPVRKDRFVIGRGRHCDLVIDSVKISREHAAIVREGDAWFIEDLGSANGTWHHEAKIQRRRIEHGDEYFLSAERIRCTLR